MNRLRDICYKALEDKGLQAYRKRLEEELSELEIYEEVDEYLKYYDEDLVFPENENNLITAYLLGICDDVNLDKTYDTNQGESPDVDVDYISNVRQDIKNVWAPKKFGEDYACGICAYTKYGIKMAITELAGVHGLDKSEIQAITTQMGLKDDDGSELTWEGALKLYPDFKAYCEKYPAVADAAYRFLGRNKNFGKHAGGLIISKYPISDVVPLIVTADGSIASAWPEGLNTQELQPVGYVKFDCLVVSDIERCDLCNTLIKQRHGLTKICGTPEGNDWSDLDYLNDPKSLALAASAKMKGIFQFESPGMRKLCKDGGVDSFEDLAAYTALFRPGPLGMKMDQVFIKNKKDETKSWLEKIHPLLRPILGVTYGVMVYQEQVMQILNKAGNIPLTHCEKIRKAISKKKIAQFIKYKEQFIKNCQDNLDFTLEASNNLWDQIESFSEYGFNKSVTKSTLIPYVEKTCGSIKLKKIEDFVPGDIVLCVNEAGATVETEVVALHDHGQLPAFEITFDDGYKMSCSINHKFLTEKGQIPLHKILGKNYTILCDPQIKDRIYAEEEVGRLDGSLRGKITKSPSLRVSSKNLPGMSDKIVHDRGMDSPLWGNIQNSHSVKKTPTDMRRMSEACVEDAGGGWSNHSNNTYITMRSTVYDESRISRTSYNLRKLQQDQTTKHNSEEYEVESVGCSEESFIEGCKNYIGSTRNSSSESGTTKKVAGKQPGGIRKMHGSSHSQPEAIQNGNLVEIEYRVGLGYGKDSLRGGSQTNRLCEGKYLDRSGRLLSLLRDQQGEAQVANCSSSGCNGERGGDTSPEHNVAENEHGMFSFLDGRDEVGMVGVVPEHAKITDTGHLVCRKIVRVVPLGERQMYDLEVANPTHNFVMPNGVVTSNSHAVAYTYITMRLLWQKAHYPAEFFTACLMSESEPAKIKEYKLESQRFGIPVCKLSLNESKENFTISDDNKILIGFSKLKGVGEAAKDIVANQPYSSFDDFLNKFGTDSRVVQPLLALGLFGDNKKQLFGYYEFFKDFQNKRNTVLKSNENSLNKLLLKLGELLNEDDVVVLRQLVNNITNYYDSQNEITNFHTIIRERFDLGDIDYAQLWKQVQGYNKKVREQAAKKDAKDNIFNEKGLSTFGDNLSIELDMKGKARANSMIEYLKLFDEPVYKSELQHYGFAWTNPIENLPDYDGDKTFLQFSLDSELALAPIECQIVEPIQRKVGKSGTVYYTLRIEDADFDRQSVVIWESDYLRFKEELSFWDETKQGGNYIRISLVRPGKFNTYSLYSPRRNKVPKEVDGRIIVLGKP